MAARTTARRKTKRRPGLSRARVLETALGIVDAEGMDALTMRRLGRELGVEAMSIYNHVEDKPALLSGILDLAVSDFQLPAAQGDDWKPWIREWMRSARKLFLAHPQLFRVLLGNPSLGPNMLAMIDAFFERLQAAGFNDDEQVRAWEVLKSFLFGNLVQTGIRSSELADLRECCPSLARILPSYACCDFDRLFESGLEVILPGLHPASGDPRRRHG